MIEPVYEDGSVGPLTVVNLNHVVLAYYDESPPDVDEDDPGDPDTGGRRSPADGLGEG